MSTQPPSDVSITFAISHPFSNLRLMECPEDLLELITSGKDRLRFKSGTIPSARKQSASFGSGGTGDVKEGYLHLCSNHKVWAVKQVSTSNSLFVAQASGRVDVQSEVKVDADAEVDGDTANDIQAQAQAQTPSKPKGRLTALSKPTSILELHPLPSATDEDVLCSYIRSLLPTIHTLDDEDLPTTTLTAAEILDAIPAPDPVLRDVFSKLCVCTLHNSFIPSAEVLVSIWKTCLDHCSTSNTPLSSLQDADVLSRLLVNETELFRCVADTLFITHVGQPSTLSSQGGMLCTPRDATLWIGGTFLQASSKGNKLNRETFLMAWWDLVPADWISNCTVSALERCEVSNEHGVEFVRWTGKDELVEKVSAAGKRKWHEKFAGERALKK